MAHVFDAAEGPQDAQSETIRSTMSFSNILSSPALNESSVHGEIAVPPSTPTKVSTPVGEKFNPVDTVTADLSETGTHGKAPVPATPPTKMSSPLGGLDDPPNSVTSSLSEPEDSTEDDETVDEAAREFVCVNDEFSPCKTGQITKDLSRKVISDHFGRNKSCTRHISNWPLFCRKHYQRATYDKKSWQFRKINLILRQFDIIEGEYPGTTYDLHLKKSEEIRLNQYSRLVAAGMSNNVAATQAAAKNGKHFEAPLDVLRELDQYLGSDKSLQQAKDVIDIIAQMLEGKDTEQIPGIEFLPKLGGDIATPKKKAPATPKTPKTPKTSKTPTTSRRISSAGAIKKIKQED